MTSSWSPLRTVLKQRAELVLSSSGARWITRRRRQNRRLILAYHGVLPEGETATGERSLHIPERDLRDQLDVLAEIVEVVSLDKLDEPSPRPRAAVTFDDAYQGALAVGVPEMVRRAMPVTVFVAPGRLGRQAFWWDSIANTNGTVDEEMRRVALTNFRGIDDQVRGWIAAAGLPSCIRLPDYARTATEKELQAALTLPGVTVGSHSWSHPNLTSLNSSDLLNELEKSYSWLKKEFGGKMIPWLAFPYGLHSSATARAAATVGYSAALAISGGWHSPAESLRFARPRLNVPAGISVAGFKSRLLGTFAT